jgi:putative ABC transport system permease protein
MIRNILLVTFRNLVKHRSYTLINTLGLALGMAAFIVIGAYTRFEKSYDRVYEDAGHIYRVESQFFKGNVLTDDWPTSTNGYATAMKENIAGIASVTRINWHNSERVVRYNNLKFREEHVCFADSNFFTFFSYPLLKGDPANVLSTTHSIVLSESAARKYFGNADPIGKALDVSTQSDSYHCAVTGVFKDLPGNSTMQFPMLVSWATTPDWLKDFWYMHESYTFVKLVPGTDISKVEGQFPALAEKYKTGPAFKELKWGIQLVRLSDIHLNPAKQYEIETKGDRNAVNLLDIVAYVILIIACVNYVNLATTRSMDRAREVGIRKVSGALPLQLLFQYLLESFIIYSVAFVLAAILVVGSILWSPFFTGDGIKRLLMDESLVIQAGVIFLVCALVSGIYPAVIMIRLKPITALKGRFSFSRRGIFLRKGMVAFQFISSLLLIAGSIGVQRQIRYMSNESLGVNINQTIVVKAPATTNNYLQKIQALKTSLLAISGVTAVTTSGSVPGREVAKFAANRRFGSSKSDEQMYEMLRVDDDYVKAYGLQIIAGRDFDKSRPRDSFAVILNESAVRQFGFGSAEQSIGGKVWLESVDSHPSEVIGVIKDYHQQSLQRKFTPIVLCMDPVLRWVPTDYFSIMISSGDMQDKVAELKTVWDQYFPESSFDSFFLNDSYDRQYQQELQFGRSFMIFASLAIFVACMGLYGLTAYSTARRNKEIGVRKVLGASVQNIVSLLTWDVIRLILFCSLIAMPAAVIFINRWLNDYAFRVKLVLWQFILPIAALVLIALLTTVWLTVRAALTNPTTTLKDE